MTRGCWWYGLSVFHWDLGSKLSPFKFAKALKRSLRDRSNQKEKVCATTEIGSLRLAPGGVGAMDRSPRTNQEVLSSRSVGNERVDEIPPVLFICQKAETKIPSPKSVDDQTRQRRLKKSRSVDCLLPAAGGDEKAVPKQRIKRTGSVEQFDAFGRDEESGSEIVRKVASTVENDKHKESKTNRKSSRKIKKSDSEVRCIADCEYHDCIDADAPSQAEEGEVNDRVYPDSSIQKSDGKKKKSKEEKSRRRRLKKSNSVDCLNLNIIDGEVEYEAELKASKEKRSKEVNRERTGRRPLIKSNSVDCIDASWMEDANGTTSDASQERKHGRHSKKITTADGLGVKSKDEKKSPNSARGDSKQERSRRRRLKKTHSVDCLGVESPSEEVSTNQDDHLLEQGSTRVGEYLYIEKKKKIKKVKSARHVGLIDSPSDEGAGLKTTKDGTRTADGAKSKKARLKKGMSIGCLVGDGVEEAVSKVQVANISKIREKAKKKKSANKEESRSLENGLVVPSEPERISCEPERSLVSEGSPAYNLAENTSVASPSTKLNSQEKKVFAITDRIKSTDLPAKMEFAEAFAQVRGNRRTMQNLDLGGARLSTAQCSAFSMALKDNWFLKELHLVDVDVGPALGMILSHGLKQNKTLERLYLQSNNLGDTGTEALASAMAENQRISLLNLARNDIGDIGAAALAEVLSSNSREDGGLKRLYLYENRIQDLGAEALSVLIACNTSLEEVYVWENKFKSKGLAELTKAVKLRYSCSPPKPIHLRVTWKSNIR